MSDIHIVQAGVEHLDEVLPLFDAYRVFYEQVSDESRARAFLEKRLRRGDSVIFLAYADEAAAGFVQLYPSFSSVSTARLWILNDLYVSESARRQGVARALLVHSAEWAAERGAIGLALETAADNVPAKALYESLGWRRVTAFDRYELHLSRH